MGLASCDVPITRAVFDTLANHYPERMGVLWMYDAPYVFWGLWTVCAPPPLGRAKNPEECPFPRCSGRSTAA